MTVLNRDPAKAYLRRLDAELTELPRARRREIVEEITGHIEESGATNEVDIRNVLDRLGDPAEIADEARVRFGVSSRRGGILDVAALILLLIGGFLGGVGWFVGVALLWGSTIWTTREKLLGTLIVPGGLLVPFVFIFEVFGQTCFSDGVHESCTGGSGLPDLVASGLFAFVVVGPIAMVAYLARQRRRRSG